jgi:hypothetical protein
VRFAAIILFFPALLGGIVLVVRYTKKGKVRDRAAIAVAICTPIFLLFVPLTVAGDWPASYTPLVLHEAPFDWPAGCADRKYNDGDQISIACHDYRNALPRKLLYDHGFPGLIERTEHDYFRVGPDAINFACNYFTEKCTVRHAEHNVFR